MTKPNATRDMGIALNSKTYMTPEGYKLLKDELKTLLDDERPKLVETVRWAAGNGDRSENGDYIYGKKRLREIDKRVRYITKRIDNSEVVDPSRQKGSSKIFFGATVSYIKDDSEEVTIKIVGIDEADISNNKISYISPVAKALMKHEEGDIVEINTPIGICEIEILSIVY